MSNFKTFKNVSYNMDGTITISAELWSEFAKLSGRIDAGVTEDADKYSAAYINRLKDHRNRIEDMIDQRAYVTEG